ncbi:hypothetical protein OOK31_35650 [Streptomyces sp. NBC_00249]|uniref:hypothetical protein n=1 Tax=Streptomyces sp. NBC_00249 TaxID=2975690 RepID=UPI00224E347D|nr:hypothetical protein [Streptomyces sp. NBC_00249]MCX5199160.1 hypothetical protein [Streptomyces sp. NBC_00249]
MRGKDHSRKPTPPSQAPGESGDPEARKEAEEAVLPRTGDGEAGDALTPNSEAQRRAAAKAGRGNGKAGGRSA